MTASTSANIPSASAAVSPNLESRGFALVVQDAVAANDFIRIQPVIEITYCNAEDLPNLRLSDELLEKISA
jgi:hypothetical protein